MAAPAPILTQLTTISIQNASGTPVAIGGVKSIKGLGSGKAKEIPTSTLSSTAAEFVQGLRDFGGFSLDLIRNQDDPGQLEMFNACAAQATRVFVVTMPTSANNIMTFSGFVENVPVDIESDNVVMGSANIRITGPIVFS